MTILGHIPLQDYVFEVSLALLIRLVHGSYHLFNYLVHVLEADFHFRVLAIPVSFVWVAQPGWVVFEYSYIGLVQVKVVLFIIS